jgi:hypothetical protein
VEDQAVMAGKGIMRATALLRQRASLEITAA